MKDKTLLEKIAFILATVVGVVSLYAVFVPILPTYLTRSLHLSTMITLLFLVKPFKKLDKGVKKQHLHIIDIAAIIIAWVSFAYNTINYDPQIRLCHADDNCRNHYSRSNHIGYYRRLPTHNWLDIAHPCMRIRCICDGWSLHASASSPQRL